MDTTFKQTLKAKAHHLKPVVFLGAKGLTPAVIAEADVALKAHELIKIKISHAEKIERQALANELCEHLGAFLVQPIGNIIVVYRKNPE